MDWYESSMHLKLFLIFLYLKLHWFVYIWEGFFDSSSFNLISLWNCPLLQLGNKNYCLTCFILFIYLFFLRFVITYFVTRRLLTLACHVGAFLMSKSATNFAKSIKSYILCPITYKNCLYLAFAFVCFIKDVALLCFALWKIVIGSTHSMNIVVGFLVYDATLE